MRTERQKEKIVTRLLAVATIAIIVVGILIAMIAVFRFRG
jgi:heme/copper-type cytochrome/quinol oxidase subunit 2